MHLLPPNEWMGEPSHNKRRLSAKSMVLKSRSAILPACSVFECSFEEAAASWATSMTGPLAEHRNPGVVVTLQFDVGTLAT